MNYLSGNTTHMTYLNKLLCAVSFSETTLLTLSVKH